MRIVYNLRCITQTKWGRITDKRIVGIIFPAVRCPPDGKNILATLLVATNRLLPIFFRFFRSQRKGVGDPESLFAIFDFFLHVFLFLDFSKIPKKWTKSEEKRNLWGRWVLGLVLDPPRDNPGCTSAVPVPPNPKHVAEPLVTPLPQR